MDNSLPDSVVYWRALWRDLIGDFESFHSGLRLESPELLIEEIIAELEAGGFYTKSIRKRFYQRLNGFVKESPDPIIEASFQVEFGQLRRVFNQKPEAYVFEVAREVKRQVFDSGRYFDEALALLTGKLCSDEEGSLSEESRSVVKTLTRNLVVALLLKGYSLERTEKIPGRLFASVQVSSGKAATLYPQDTKALDYEDAAGKVDWERYNEALAAEIESLSVRDRLLKLGHYYHLSTEELIYIFPVVGYKGKEENQEYGDVRVYSPKHVQLIEGDIRGATDEHFHRDEEDIEDYVNVAVKAECLDDPEGARLKAARKAERMLDFLSILVEPRETLYIRSHEALVTDASGRHRGSHASVPEGDETYAHRRGQNIEVFEKLGWENSIEGAQKYIYKNPSGYSSEERTIAYSLTWHRKAGAAGRAEDQLLGYWVAMENLVTDIGRGQAAVLAEEESDGFGKDYFLSELAPAVVMRNALIRSAHSLRHTLSSPLGLRNGIPENLRSAAGLDVGLYQPIKLRLMIDRLDDLKSHIESALVLELARSVEELFRDPAAAKSFLESEAARVRRLVEQIYRYRNKVVHYGHYGSVAVPYYAAMAGHVSKAFLQRVAHPFNVDGIPVRESLLQSHVRLEMLTERFKNGTSLYDVVFQSGLFGR